MPKQIKCTQGDLNTPGEFGIPDPVYKLLVAMNLISKKPSDADMKIISVVSHLWNGDGSLEFLRLKLLSMRKDKRTDAVELCDLTHVERYVFSTYREAYEGGFKINKAILAGRVNSHFHGARLSDDALKSLQRRARQSSRRHKNNIGDNE
ncbi:hypothetical protein FY034_18110 (plasmid) [Trichlorobacter lovleyi]|uniref:hypothetical protein n=1 Tax=Trichlorobacter lovleyi TaxID=313985 RepID=UPI0022406BF4|nr:hypothetical protein [Trichlorobacter lovleyi]QOX80916.1 hypothetical protein FY034_18110 [Trichlorobacter lovleyi]